MSSHGFLNSMLLVQWVPLLVITRELKKMEQSPGCKQMKDLGPFLSQDMRHLPRRFNLRSRARSIFYHPLPLYPHFCTEGYNGSGKKKNTIPFIYLMLFLITPISVIAPISSINYYINIIIYQGKRQLTTQKYLFRQDQSSTQ